MTTNNLDDCTHVAPKGEFKAGKQFFRTRIEEAERDASCKDDAELYYRGLSFAYGKSEQAIKEALLKMKDRFFERLGYQTGGTMSEVEYIIDETAKELGIDLSQENEQVKKERIRGTLKSKSNKRDGSFPDTHNQNLKVKKCQK